MLALATYLGHVNIDSTYWYLESTSELLAGIAAAGELFLGGGQS
jgi:integrase/recombinase XerD